jgi:hypothetical protein
MRRTRRCASSIAAGVLAMSGPDAVSTDRFDSVSVIAPETISIRSRHSSATAAATPVPSISSGRAVCSRSAIRMRVPSVVTE